MIASTAVLVDRARSATGLADFGADGWQEGLDRLVSAADRDLVHDDATVARIEAIIVGRLTNRLRIEQWYAAHADEATAIDGPIVIFGIPRTGTTALHHLLSLDPRFRYPRRWELTDPLPPPELTSEVDDPRRQAALDRAARGDQVSVQHISAVDGPADDGTLLGLDFHNQETGLPVPTYTTWWRGASLSTTYAYHERVLRMLSSHRPPQQWLVKAPYHAFHLDDLAAHYPTARFLMTHRDPAVAIASACSTVGSAQRAALPGQPCEPRALGAFLLEHQAAGIEAAMAARHTIGEERFLDVSQQALENNAVEVAERIYHFLDLPLDERTADAMEQWAVTNRRGARGEHRYHAEDYGLTAAQIRRTFTPYIERFGALLDEA